MENQASHNRTRIRLIAILAAGILLMGIDGLCHAGRPATSARRVQPAASRARSAQRQQQVTDNRQREAAAQAQRQQQLQARQQQQQAARAEQLRQQRAQAETRQREVAARQQEQRQTAAARQQQLRADRQRQSELKTQRERAQREQQLARTAQRRVEVQQRNVQVQQRVVEAARPATGRPARSAERVQVTERQTITRRYERSGPDGGSRHGSEPDRRPSGHGSGSARPGGSPFRREAHVAQQRRDVVGDQADVAYGDVSQAEAVLLEREQQRAALFESQAQTDWSQYSDQELKLVRQAQTRERINANRQVASAKEYLHAAKVRRNDAEQRERIVENQALARRQQVTNAALYGRHHGPVGHGGHASPHGFGSVFGRIRRAVRSHVTVINPAPVVCGTVVVRPTYCPPPVGVISYDWDDDYDEGYDDGFDDGYDVGYDVGYDDGSDGYYAGSSVHVYDYDPPTSQVHVTVSSWPGLWGHGWQATCRPWRSWSPWFGRYWHHPRIRHQRLVGWDCLRRSWHDNWRWSLTGVVAASFSF